MSHHLRILRKPLSLTGLLLLCLCTVFAQFGGMGFYRQANKLFAQKNYFEAAQCYEKYLASEKKIKPRGQPFAVEKKRKGRTNLNTHEDAIYHLAQCYLNTHDFVQAEKWYRQAVSFSREAYPACQYEYAVSLRANQKYDEAMEAIDSFLQNYSVMDELLLSADREYENLKYIRSQLRNPNKDQFILIPEKADDAASSYALAVQNGDTVVFTSIRAKYSTKKPGTDVYYNNLFSAVAGDGLHNTTGMGIPEEADIQNGLASFARNGNIMFFTRWTKNNGKTSSAIYRCKRTAAGWSEPVKLPAPVNMEEYNSTQPFVTANDYLLFSSDRPGGIGKYDLWYASLDSSLEAYSVANMGNNINTPEDDQSPYYHQQSGTLVFASNGRTGMGGFDIYYAKNESNFTHFSQPVNPGIPINSSKDDLYFISTDADNLWNSGWLSSDRSTDCCLALFSFHENNPGDKRNTVIMHGPSDTINKERLYREPVKTDAVQIVKDALKSLSRTNTVGNFAYKKAALPAAAMKNLDSLTDLMKRNPSLIVQLEGYTDGIGGTEYNKRLARARVDACIKYLTARGVSADQLIGKGMGECCPIRPERINGKDDPAARQINRRVEYKIVSG